MRNNTGTGIKTKIWPTAIQQLGSLCSNNKNQEQVTTMKKIWPCGPPLLTDPGCGGGGGWGGWGGWGSEGVGGWKGKKRNGCQDNLIERVGWVGRETKQDMELKILKTISPAQCKIVQKYFTGKLKNQGWKFLVSVQIGKSFEINFTSY